MCMADRARTFQATLERGTQGMGWTVVCVPFDPHAVWKQMLRLRVRGEVNGVAFRTSLFPMAGGGLCLLVNNGLQRAAGLALGSVATFTLEPDLEARPAELPDALADLLEEEAGLRDWYDALSESMRREIGKWIGGVKGEAARLKRCEQMAERLLAAMEAEQALPPAIAQALRRHPKAAAGWERMTPVQRRSELLGVFYYQTVEARTRRIEKLCEAAAKRADD